MKIGLISDTHDHMEYTSRAIGQFKSRGVEVILHAGDFVSPPLIKLFDGCGMTLHGVFGNNDGEVLGLERCFGKIDARLHGDFASLELAGERIAIYHGTSPGLLECVVASGLYDLVVTGHTHKVRREVHGKTMLLNPGSAHGWGGTPTVMVHDTSGGQTEVLELKESKS